MKGAQHLRTDTASQNNGTRTVLLTALIVVAGATCGKPNDDGDDAADRDAKIRRPPVTREVWQTEEVASGHVGLHTRTVITADGPAIAYFATQGREDGPCDELGVSSPPTRELWDLYVARSTGSGWSAETVASILSLAAPSGLGFAVDSTGRPAIASLTGGAWVAPVGYCSANDVGFYRPADDGSSADGWSVQTAVATSGEAATGEPASDFGEVVGYWPALAFDADDNPAIAYKDIHGGGLQSDDLRRADLELALQSGSSWRAVAVDIGEGAGDYNALVFDDQNRPVIAYYQPVESQGATPRGVWVARSADDGASWQRVQLLAGATVEGPAMLVDPDDGRLHVAYYDAALGVPRMATLQDDDNFEALDAGWTDQRFGEERFDEGYHLSLAAGPNGIIAAAYYRCTRATGELGVCRPDDDALVFAWRKAGTGTEGSTGTDAGTGTDTGTWSIEVVDEGDAQGACGTHASLAFDSDGSAVISYLCQTLVGNALDDRVRVARREPL